MAIRYFFIFTTCTRHWLLLLLTPLNLCSCSSEQPFHSCCCFSEHTLNSWCCSFEHPFDSCCRSSECPCYSGSCSSEHPCYSGCCSSEHPFDSCSCSFAAPSYFSGVACAVLYLPSSYSEATSYLACARQGGEQAQYSQVCYGPHGVTGQHGRSSPPRPPSFHGAGGGRSQGPGDPADSCPSS